MTDLVSQQQLPQESDRSVPETNANSYERTRNQPNLRLDISSLMEQEEISRTH